MTPKVLVIGDGPARGWFENALPRGVFAGFQTGKDLKAIVTNGNPAKGMPAFGQKTIATRALCPLDANEVKDIQGYLDAETRPSTRLWQEAVADTFAVGYWKLTAPDAAADLVATLRRKREGAENDPTHATTC